VSALNIFQRRCQFRDRDLRQALVSNLRAEFDSVQTVNMDCYILSPTVELKIAYADASTLRRASAGVTMGMLSKELRSAGPCRRRRSDRPAWRGPDQYLVRHPDRGRPGWQGAGAVNFGECLNPHRERSREVSIGRGRWRTGPLDHFRASSASSAGR